LLNCSALYKVNTCSKPWH